MGLGLKTFPVYPFLVFWLCLFTLFLFTFFLFTFISAVVSWKSLPVMGKLLVGREGGRKEGRERGRKSGSDILQRLLVSSAIGGPMEPLSPAVAGGGGGAGGAVMSLPHQPVPHAVPYGQELHFQQCE